MRSHCAFVDSHAVRRVMLVSDYKLGNRERHGSDQRHKFCLYAMFGERWTATINLDLIQSNEERGRNAIIRRD